MTGKSRKNQVVNLLPDFGLQLTNNFTNKNRFSN
jgi:hypothetical protein